nr:hypothetical protein [Deltaproteobacteria bacterium]
MSRSGRLALLSLCICGCRSTSPTPPQSAPSHTLSAAETDAQAAVRATFERYRAALLAKDGATAAALIDEATTAWYERALKLAATAGGTALAEEDASVRLTVYRLRHEFSLEQIERMNGREVVEEAVARGWLSESSVRRVGLATVTVEGDRATTTGLDPIGTPGFEFRRERGKWRIDLVPVMGSFDTVLEALVERSETGSETAVIVALLEKLSGRRVDLGIFHGPAGMPVERIDRASYAVTTLDRAVVRYAEEHGFVCTASGPGPGSTGLVAQSDCAKNVIFSAVGFAPSDPEFMYSLRWNNDSRGACQFTAQAFADLDDDEIYATYERASAIDHNGANHAGLFVDRED